MNRYLIPMLFTVLSVGVYLSFIQDTLKSISVELGNEKILDGYLEDAGTATEKLQHIETSYESIPKTDEEKLRTLFPDTIDDLRLIVDVNTIAERNGLIMEGANPTTVPSTPENPLPYVTHTLEFSVTATYDVFHAFLSDLEKSLQLRNVTKIAFKPEIGGEEDAMKLLDPAKLLSEYTIEITSYSMM